MPLPALAYQDWPPVSSCRPSTFPCAICAGPTVWDGPYDAVLRCYGCYYVCWIENGTWMEWLCGTEFCGSGMRAKLTAALKESEGWWWPPKELFQGF